MYSRSIFFTQIFQVILNTKADPFNPIKVLHTSKSNQLAPQYIWCHLVGLKLWSTLLTKLQPQPFVYPITKRAGKFAT